MGAIAAIVIVGGNDTTETPLVHNYQRIWEEELRVVVDPEVAPAPDGFEITVYVPDDYPTDSFLIVDWQFGGFRSSLTPNNVRFPFTRTIGWAYAGKYRVTAEVIGPTAELLDSDVAILIRR